MSELPTLGNERAAEADKRHEEAMMQEKLSSVMDNAQEIYDAHDGPRFGKVGFVDFDGANGLSLEEDALGFKEVVDGKEIKVFALSVRSGEYYELDAGNRVDQQALQKVGEVAISTLDQRENYIIYELERYGGDGAPVSVMAMEDGGPDVIRNEEVNLVAAENRSNLSAEDSEFPYLSVESVIHLVDQAINIAGRKLD